MKRSLELIFRILIFTALLLGVAGCRSLLEENPEDQQLPWATPADWEGTIPGMPTKR